MSRITVLELLSGGWLSLYAGSGLVTGLAAYVVGGAIGGAVGTALNAPSGQRACGDARR